MSKRNRIAIFVKGGLVTNVETDLEQELEVMVIDMDNEGVDEDELTPHQEVEERLIHMEEVSYENIIPDDYLDR